VSTVKGFIHLACWTIRSRQACPRLQTWIPIRRLSFPLSVHGTFRRFQSEDADVDTVRRDMRKLDGIPLAIEFAALCWHARMNGLASRLNYRLRLLSLRGTRFGPPSDAARTHDWITDF